MSTLSPKGASASAQAYPPQRQEIEAPEIAEAQPSPAAESLQQAAQKRAEEAEQRVREREQQAAEAEAAAREARAQTDDAIRDAQARAADAAEAPEPEVNEVEAEPQSNVTTYAGITNQQLEQMYRDGEISRYDYDAEIAAREARQEEMRSDSAQMNQEAAAIGTVQRNTDNSAIQVKNLASEASSDTLSAQQRQDIINAAQNENTKEERREEEQGRLWDYQLLT